MAGLGSHSFRRGCALALFHVGAGREAVTEVLRHRSLLSSGPYVTDAELVADLAVTMAAAAPSRPFPVAAVGSARIGAPGHSAVIQFRLQSSPTRSGEFLLEWGGLPWERGLISRCHAGWVSGRDCLLEFVTRPTKLHMLARLATWTVHGEYRGLRAAHGLARLATWTVHGEYRCPRAAHGHPRVHRRRTRDAFVSHMEHGALCPAGRVPLQAGRQAIAECTRCLTARCRQARAWLVSHYTPRGTALDLSLAQRSCVCFAPAGSSPPICREIRRFWQCLPRATRGYPPGLGDTGRAAAGRAGSFISRKKGLTRWNDGSSAAWPLSVVSLLDPKMKKFGHLGKKNHIPELSFLEVIPAKGGTAQDGEDPRGMRPPRLSTEAGSVPEPPGRTRQGGEARSSAAWIL